MFTSRISLNIKGKNINRFIRKLKVNKIELLTIKHINKDEIEITIKRTDYEKVKKIKTIYEIKQLKEFGLIKITRSINKNLHLIIIILISMLSLLILSNMIFKIEIIHSNKEIRNLLKKELYKKGFKKYSFKKGYKTIQKVKEDIKLKYPDKIEWLEIESSGTKYIVKVEERKISKIKEEEKPRDIVAKKPGILKKVIANKGEIVKDMDDYVEAGDVIISGNLVFNDEVKGKVKAEGKVYAEIWYKTKTKYPLVIVKEEKTGKVKNVYSIELLKKRINLSIKKFNKNNVNKKEIFSHPLLPIKLVKERKEKLKEKSYILTYDEAIEKAKEASIKEIKRKIKSPEYIIRNAYLKSNVNNSTIEVEMFFAIYEDITDYREIGD